MAIPAQSTVDFSLLALYREDKLRHMICTMNEIGMRMRVQTLQCGFVVTTKCAYRVIACLRTRYSWFAIPQRLGKLKDANTLYSQPSSVEKYCWWRVKYDSLDVVYRLDEFMGAVQYK